MSQPSDESRQVVDQTGQSADGSPSADNDEGSPDDFFTVAIGTSAGGIHTVQELFEHIPDHPNLAFVLLQHMSPDADSGLVELLSHHTNLPCSWISEGSLLKAGHLFVVPPDKKVAFQDGRFAFSGQGRTGYPVRSIDDCFEALASELQSRLIGVVLTGEGDDGTDGLNAVKRNGGVTIAQDPSEAEHPSMPRNAVARAKVDAVLSLAEIAARLVHIQHQDPSMHDTPADQKPVAGGAEEGLNHILEHLRRHTGHDLHQYKRSSLRRRIGRRMQVQGARGLGDYLERLRSDDTEAQKLLQDILITVTKFFRDPPAFDVLREEVIPELADGHDNGEPVRIWVPGCATGEEAYSIGMLVHEHFYSSDAHDRVESKIFGTDIDQAALQRARDGRYSARSLERLSDERRRRFFIEDGDRFKVVRELRDTMLFAVHNVLSDPPFARLDLISCRNLLIYLRPEAQQQIFEIAHYALREGGYLFLGESESAGRAGEYFEVVDKSASIYRAKFGPRAPLPTQNLSADDFPEVARPGRVGVSRDHEVDRQPRGTLEGLHRRVLADLFGPASVIIDEQFQIVHLSPRAQDYLAIPEGIPTHNLLDMADQRLRSALQVMMFHYTEHREELTTGPIRYGQSGSSDGAEGEESEMPQSIKISVYPVEEAAPSPASQSHKLSLVVFEPSSPPASETRLVDAEQRREDAAPMVEQLQDRLEETREKLRATVERHETANEELQASNEELLAMNEELQSSTEELETSKEELQSTNEELSTVNQELNDKFDELAEINNDLKNLLAATDIGTIFLDTDLHITRFTPAVTDFSNLIEADIGRPIGHVTHDLDYDQLEDDARRVLDDRVNVNREVACGEGRWFIVRMLPYRTADHRVEGVVVSFVDITERKKYEEALLEAKQASDRLAQLRTTFMANMSHEVRTPLTSIIGLAQLLSRRLGDGQEEEERDMAARIHRSANRLLKTLDSVMDLSRIESGELQASWETFDIVAEVADAVDELRVVNDLDDVELNFRTPMDTHSVVSDRGFVSSIATNLVQNALKFTDEGEVDVILAATDGGVCLRVQDTGRGIEEEFMSELFVKFKRAGDSATTHADAGSGLGLALVKHMVDQLGGQISVESVPGQGTTFMVDLPERPEPADDAT